MHVYTIPVTPTSVGFTYIVGFIGYYTGLCIKEFGGLRIVV